MRQKTTLTLAQAATALLAKTAPPTSRSARVVATLFFALLMTVTAWADDRGDFGTAATWAYNSSTKTLTISGTGALTEYSGTTVNLNTDKRPFANHKDDCEHIVIEEGITSIGVRDFAFMNNVTSVSIPATVTTIGGYGFYRSGGYSPITFTIADGSHLSSMGECAFMRDIATIDLSSCTSLTAIPKNAFHTCSNVTLPNTVTSVVSGGLQNCTHVYVAPKSGCALEVNGTTVSLGTNGLYDVTSLVNNENTITFTWVNPNDLSLATLTLNNAKEGNWYAYQGGNAIDIAVTVDNANGTRLMPTTDYTVSITNSSDETVTTITAEDTYTLTVTGTGSEASGYFGSTQTTFTVSGPIALTSETTAWRDGRSYYAEGEVTIGSRATVSGAVTLDLRAGSSLTVNGGISVNEGRSLTIGGTGSLTATATTTGNAGIGANDGMSAGTITINGGTITATGGSRAAGIGGGAYNYAYNVGGDCGTITINGGIVNATKGDDSATGIGLGWFDGSYDSKTSPLALTGTVTINGGQVTATGLIGYNDTYAKKLSCSITLGWTDWENDFIETSKGYKGTVGFVTGKTLQYTDGSISTIVTTENIGSMGGKRLTPYAAQTYTVTFDTGEGATTVTQQTLPEGYTATEPEAPMRTGYRFAGWKNGTTAYDFSATVTSNLTLTAAWEAVSAISYIADDGSTVTGFTQYIPLESKYTTLDGNICGTWVVNANLTQSNRIIIKNNVTLILTDGKTLTAQKGISVTARDNAALTVLAQSGGTGALTVTGVNNQSDASIGGDFADGRYGCGTVKIYGGHISTSGKLFGAGIGGAGGYGAGGTISILGGQVDIYNGTNGNNAIGYGDGATGGYATATITLGWTRETDYIHLHPGSTGAACYKGTVTLASNFLIDGVTPATRARWTSESNNIDGQKLVPNTEGLMDWSEVQEGLTAGQTVTLTNDVASASTDKTLTVPNGVTAAIDLNGHTLTHQYASDTGLETAVIVIMKGGTLTISDGSSSKTGKIVGNKTGIYNQTSGSTLTMTGGTINTTDTGILNYGTVTLSGVTVSGSSNSGINSGGTLSMADCSVTGNSGGGIYNSGTLNLAGKITVTGNTRTSNSETYDFNLFLSAGIINLTGAITDDSRIGVYGANCAITSGANGKAVLANFISDATDQYICWTTDGTEVQLNQLYYMNERDGMADLVSRHQGETVPVLFVRSFTDGVATTICLPFQINSLTYQDFGTFYRFVGVDESTRTVTMEDANKLSGLLDPNTPYLFMPKVSEEVSFRPQKGTITVANSYTAGTMVSGSWTLSGTYSAKIWDDEDTEIDKAYFINDEGKLQKIVSGMKTAPMSCYLLREVESLTLYDSNSNADGNTSAIAAAATSGNTYDVTLSGRTLTKDGNWNTLCLPFAVSAAQLAETSNPLYGATVKELDATNSNLGSDGILTLTFKDATSIDAGKPYLVKWTTGENISNPVFNGVTITATAPTAVEFANNANASGQCQFVGQFSPFTIDAGNLDKIILLGAANTLGYSQAARTLRSFRAHFMVPTDGGAAPVRGFVLDFGEGQTTSITEMRNEELEMRNVFNLNGQRVSQPTKGLYIVNGRKVVVK